MPEALNPVRNICNPISFCLPLIWHKKRQDLNRIFIPKSSPKSRLCSFQSRLFISQSCSKVAESSCPTASWPGVSDTRFFSIARGPSCPENTGSNQREEDLGTLPKFKLKINRSQQTTQPDIQRMLIQRKTMKNQNFSSERNHGRLPFSDFRLLTPENGRNTHLFLVV